MATFGTFSAGQVLTAAELNAAGTWTTYTPTWTNLTVGNGTQTFRYMEFNKVGMVQGELTFGTTTSITGNVTFTLPSGWTNGNQPISSFCNYLDAGVADYYGFVVRSSNTVLVPIVANVAATYLGGSNVNATQPFTWGNTDVLRVGALVRLS